MKTIDEIIANYSEYETFLDDRFGVRLCRFLTEEQARTIGFKLKDGAEWRTPKAWTEENVIEQLKKDLDFGFAKCEAERGISSELMYYVCRSWCVVLENGLESIEPGSYARDFFAAVAAHYNHKFNDVETRPGYVVMMMNPEGKE